MKNIKYVLMVLWILLIPFQNSGLRETPLGVLGASPAFIPLMALIFISGIEWCLNWKELKVNRNVLFIIAYVVIINIVYLVLNGPVSHGTSLLTKTVNLSVLTFLSLFPVFFIRYDQPTLGLVIQISFCIAVLGVVLCDIMKLNFLTTNPLIYYRESINMRPQGFCRESSQLSAMLIAMGLLSAYFSKTVWAKAAFLALTVSLVLFSASKGGFLSLSVVAIIVILLQMKSRPWLTVFLVPIGGAIVYFVYGFISLQFAGNIAEYASITSRLDLAITSVITAIHNPFGVGFSGFLPAMDKYIPAASEFIQRMSGINMNFTEVISYVMSGSDEYIGTKTFLFDFLIFYGWPFLALYLWFNYKLFQHLRDSKNIILLAVLLYVFLAISTYKNPNVIYNISLAYGVIWYEVHRKKDLGSSA